MTAQALWRRSNRATMVDVSVIVPVYLVEGQLRECLDSILAQDHPSFEVIAVNDASPDGSPSILREYAAQDERLKIIDLPVNQGLGAARNAGIAEAIGQWIWFVDSDDWIEPGAIGAAVGRAQETGAEIVIFDYRRIYPDGRVLRGGRTDILADAPERFTVRDYPQILQLLQIACNKLIERAALDRLELRFVDGWYEDTPFSYPLLVGTASISALPRPLLNYRQREGAITRSASARHFEVLGQWERAMERALTLSDESRTIHNALAQLMVRRSAFNEASPGRLPHTSRRTRWFTTGGRQDLGGGSSTPMFLPCSERST